MHEIDSLKDGGKSLLKLSCAGVGGEPDQDMFVFVFDKCDNPV